MWKLFKSVSLFKRPVSNEKKMPHFTDNPSPFSKIIKTIQENIDNLNSEINKYKCPKCGTGLPYEEEKDVYHGHLHQKDSTATAKKNPKNGKDKQVMQSDPSCEDYMKQLKDEKDKCKTLQEVNTNYALQIAELEKILSERELDIKNLWMLNSQLQDEKKTMTETIEERENRIGKLNVTLRETEEKEAGLQKEMERLRSVESTVQDLRKELEGMNKTLEKTQKENVNEIDRLKRSHMSALEVKDKELRTLKGMNKTLEKTQRDHTNEIDRLKGSHMSSLEVKDRELRTLKERCTGLERDIEKISRKEIAVGFSTTLAPSMSTLLLDGLMTQLTQRLTAEGVDLVRRPFYGNTDFNYPLLAICVNVSRIGADAKEALKGVVKVGNQKDVVLLVFHHKEAHALPSQSSDRLLTGAEFSNLGTIIDLAFLSQRGIYECDMNMMGIERIVSFLLQYKSQKQ